MHANYQHSYRWWFDIERAPCHLAQLADADDAALADVAMVVVVVVVVLETRIFGIFSISIQLETKRNLCLCGWCVCMCLRWFTPVSTTWEIRVINQTISRNWIKRYNLLRYDYYMISFNIFFETERHQVRPKNKLKIKMKKVETKKGNWNTRYTVCRHSIL